MTDDFDNLNYHYDNYIYPKPVENIDEEIIKTGKVPYADPNFSWHLLWPEKKYNNIGLNVLIAGCGSDQAAILAKCNPNHKFTGIDLSSNSIKQNFNSTRVLNKILNYIKRYDLLVLFFSVLQLRT